MVYFKLVSTLYFVALNLLIIAQKRDHNWMLGYNGAYVDPSEGYGLIDISFDETGIIIGDWVADSANHFRWLFNFTGIVMSSEAGEKLFYYNGFQIRDFENNIPLGGDSLNDPWVRQMFWGGHTTNNGLPIQQSSIALPVPDQEDEYIILTSTVSQYYALQGIGLSDNVYVHHLHANLQGVDIISSNETIFTDEVLNPGGFTAVRHANGRDWWLMFGKVSQNLEYIEGYHQYLLTPIGLEYQQFQAFDFPVYSLGAGQHCYSRDGSILIVATTRLNIDPFKLVIMDFDRCTGALTNIQQTEGPVLGLANGCAVSPNNRYLYVSNRFQVYQYDLESENIFDTEILVGQVDTYQLNPNFVTVAGCAQLAPDGKIYFANGSSTMGLNVIHHPDSAGLASGFEQDGLQLPVRNFRTIPNFPNYCLGALEGSPCDTLGRPYDYCATEVSTKEPEKIENSAGELVMVPNPAGQYVQVHAPEPGRLYVYDLSGRRVLDHGQATEGINTMSIASLPAGIYITVLYGESGHLYRGRLGVVE